MQRAFTPQSFARVLRAGDSRKFDVDLKARRSDVLSAAVAASETGHTTFSPVFRTTVKQRICASIKDYSQVLILRSIAWFVMKRFRVVLKNRDRIVKDVLETLSEATPMYIVRRDISSFYETLPTEKLRERITNENFVPERIRKYLECYFNTFRPSNPIGIQRGIGLSSILAELAMESYDKSIKSIDGVYRYFRYSDDILVFSFKPPAKLVEELEARLPSGMKFNGGKGSILSITNSDKKTRRPVSFEYLGYEYRFDDFCKDKTARRVEVGIPQKKIKRLKTRILRSLQSFKKNGDFGLLYDRLSFISSNYIVRRRGASVIKTRRTIRSGIFYSYHLCGIYDKSGKSPYAANELKALDGFYNSIIKNGSDFAGIMSSAQKERLLRFSFFKGFAMKMTVRFAPERVQNIKQAWKNA